MGKGKLLKYVWKNTTLKNIMGVGFAGETGRAIYKGNPLLKQISNDLIGVETSDKLANGGVIGAANALAFGSENADRSILHNAADAFVGEGTADAVRATVTGITGNGHQAGSVDSQQSAMLASQNPFQGYNDMVSNFTGGKMTGLNLASMLGAMYLVFGSRFGWLGKIAGLMLGGMTAHSMENNAARLQQQQAQAYAPYGVPYNDYASEADSEQNQRVVSRMRL